MDLMLKVIQQIPSHQRRIFLFLSAALFLHGAALFGLQAGGFMLHPELPDWMNIKLVAGLDTGHEHNIPDKKSQPPAQAKLVENNHAANEQAVDKPTEPQQAQAQDFVKADSRPFEFENPKPFYPAAARRRGMQGQVLLQVEVNVRGKVSNIKLKHSSGYRVLDESAISTVSHWRFVPAKSGGEAVRSVVLIPIRFELKQF